MTHAPAAAVKNIKSAAEPEHKVYGTISALLICMIPVIDRTDSMFYNIISEHVEEKSRIDAFLQREMQKLKAFYQVLFEN